MRPALELEAYLDQKQNCIICQSSKFAAFAKEDYLEALNCLDCGMISVNPHFSEAGLAIFYSKYFAQRQNDSLLKAQRDVAYEIDRD